MQVSVESTSNIGRKMNISVPAEKIEGEVEKRLRDMRGRVKLDGFRPGKVPLSVVSQQYGDSVHQEVVSNIVESSFREAIITEKLNIVGDPNIDFQVIESGKDLEYIATFDVYPVFEIGNIEELEIVKTNVEITDVDINKMIETLQGQQKEWQEVDRPAEKGDLVVIDFEGTIDGEAFNGGSAKEFSVEVGLGRMLKDFEKGLLGMSAGEEKVIDVTFPDDYPAENLKGKTAQFALKVSIVKESTMPAVDENFIKKFGIEDGTEESFRAEIKANMERELAQKAKSLLKQSVMDGLNKLHDIEVPSFLVNEEVKHVREEMSGSAEGADLSSLPDDLFIDQASRRVKLGLIVGEIITKNNLERDPKRVNEMLELMASTYEDPQALIKYYTNNKQAMQTLEAAVMEDMIVEWVLEKAKVIDKEMTFSELMSPEASNSVVKEDNAKSTTDAVATQEKSETV